MSDAFRWPGFSAAVILTTATPKPFIESGLLLVSTNEKGFAERTAFFALVKILCDSRVANHPSARRR